MRSTDKYECLICFDKGFIEYRTVEGYGYIAHCICNKGKKYEYNGSLCKEKSDYYIPSIYELVDVQEVELDNIKEYCRLHNEI